MGTYYTTGATKQDIIDEILEPLKRGGHLIESAVVWEHEPILWTVEKGCHKNGQPYQFIGCYILKGDCRNGWGYKPMDETAGPYFYKVPIRWLDKYPCILPEGHKGNSDSWRDKVRKA